VDCAATGPTPSAASCSATRDAPRTGTVSAAPTSAAAPVSTPSAAPRGARRPPRFASSRSPSSPADARARSPTAAELPHEGPPSGTSKKGALPSATPRTVPWAIGADRTTVPSPERVPSVWTPATTATAASSPSGVRAQAQPDPAGSVGASVDATPSAPTTASALAVTTRSGSPAPAATGANPTGSGATSCWPKAIPAAATSMGAGLPRRWAPGPVSRGVRARSPWYSGGCRRGAHMAVRDRIRSVVHGWRESRRRVWEGERLWIELRGPPGEEARAELIARLSAHPAVAWVTWNGPYQRLVVQHRGDAEAALAAVRAAEAEAGLADVPFAHDPPPHPGDGGSRRRAAVRAAADVASIGLALARRVRSQLPAAAEIDLAALTQALENLPPARRWMDQRLGGSSSDHVVGLANTLAAGWAHGTTGQAVDLAYRWVRTGEVRAREEAWRRREPELAGDRAAHPEAPAPRDERPAPLPDGPIERYGDPAGMASLGGFGFGLAVTGQAERAAASILGAVPKPARVGREAFAAELGRRLAGLGVVIADDRVLRRLDRVDTVILPRSLLEARWGEVASVHPRPGTSRAELLLRATRLLDPQAAPDPVWQLRSAAPADHAAREEGEWAAAQPANRAVRVLVRDGVGVGLVAVRRTIDPQARTLVARVREIGLRLGVTCDDAEAVAWASPELVLPEGPAARDVLRDQQAEGRGILLVADGPHPALSAADVAFARPLAGAAPPWAAHLLGTGDPAEVRWLVEGVESARAAARQSVGISIADAVAGFALSLEGQKPRIVFRIMSLSSLATLAAVVNGVRLARAVDGGAGREADWTPWHALEPDDALTRLRSRPKGLTSEEAASRAAAPPRKRTRAEALTAAVWREMSSPFAPILATGAGLSALIGSPIDAALVGGTIVASGLVGGWQQVAADEAMDELERARPVSVRVRRDGKVVERLATELVPGDVVELEAGARVPADCRLLEADQLEVDESSLTGESLPVAKGPTASFAGAVAERTSMLYADTSVAAGRAVAVVVAVGEATEARRAHAFTRTTELRGVQARLEQLTRLTSPAAGIAGLGIVASGLLRNRPVRELIDAAVSLAVAAVPETLPLLATAAELAAARRLSERGALVRNISAVEALGRVDVLCADKTGTLTEGVLRLRGVATGGAVTLVDALDEGQRDVLRVALAASPGAGDTLPHPTDRALVEGAAAAGVTPDPAAREAELPFEPRRGFHATLLRDGKRRRLCVKGAPEVVLVRCRRARLGGGTSAPFDAAAWLAQAHALAGEGLRILAVAERSARSAVLTDEKVDDLVFRGFLAIADPVRPAARASVDALRRAGVRTVMITGDHPATAAAIAREIGLGDDPVVLTGAEIDTLDDAGLDARLAEVSVFARVTPQLKVRLVAAFQRAGKVVAMTGDGANDAPAIRLADVGVALGERATAAARSAADLLVTDERIETLVHAVLEGRAMWASVRDAVTLLVGGNLGEMAFTLVGGALQGTAPLGARQLLLVNLLTDALPALTIAVRPPSHTTPESLMAEGPERSLGAPLLRELGWRAVATGAAGLVGWGLARPLSTPQRAGTVALLSVVGAQLGQTLWVGWRNPPVVAAAVGSGALLLLLVEVPGLSRLVGCVPLGPVGLTQAAIGAGVGVLGAGLLPPAWKWADGRFALGTRLAEVTDSELGRWLAESRALRRLRERSETAATLLDDVA
jgi:cation-transporting ATPase I